MSEKNSNLPCDYCGDRPAFWFGSTSVAVCRKTECQEKNQRNYEAHCETMSYSSYDEDED